MYLFFDIDGVLNKESMWRINYSLDREMVNRFCDLCHKLRALPILMSSWRTGFIGVLLDENSEPIRRLESLMLENDLKISGKTDVLKGRMRETEIERYRILHDEKREYLILDDDPGEYGVIDANTYFTDSKIGLSDTDVKKILKMYKDSF